MMDIQFVFSFAKINFTSVINYAWRKMYDSIRHAMLKDIGLIKAWFSKKTKKT
jgi:hypothetical protein